MSRRSRSAHPGAGLACQVRPPSVVRRAVPWVPLAQTTRESTTQRPRNRAPLPLTRAVHWARDDPPDQETTSRPMATRMTRAWKDENDIDCLSLRDTIRRGFGPSYDRPPRRDSHDTAGPVALSWGNRKGAEFL